MKDITITIVIEGMREFRYVVGEAAKAMEQLRLTLEVQRAAFVRAEEDRRWALSAAGLLVVLGSVLLLVLR